MSMEHINFGSNFLHINVVGLNENTSITRFKHYYRKIIFHIRYASYVVLIWAIVVSFRIQTRIKSLV